MKVQEYDLELGLMRIREKKKKRRLLIGVVIWCICIWSLLHRMYGISIVSGNSMRPSFYSGDLVIYRRGIPGKLEYGDVLIVRSWLEREKDYVKRVIGLPEDVISVDEKGYVIRNGIEVHEPEVLHGYQQEDRTMHYPYKVPEDNYFVLGDNRAVSLDSRFFGALSKKQILGKVVAVIRLGGV